MSDHNDHTEQPPKPFPQAAGPIAGMFGMSGSDGDWNEAHEVMSPTSPTPYDLPVVEAKTVEPATIAPAKEAKETSHEPVKEEHRREYILGRAGRIIKESLPYLAIFAIGIFLYYFYFSNVDLNSIFSARPSSKIAGVQTSKSKALAALEKSQSKQYQAWIAQFFFDVSDPAIIDPENDYSGNGLTNFQKYLLNLNPKSYDTVGRGYPDGITIANGLDPATNARPLEGKRKEIVDTYFDTQAIRDRITSANLNGTGQGPVNFITPQVHAAESEPIMPLGPQVNVPQPAPSPAPLPAPSPAPQPAAPKPAPSNGDKTQYENVLGINTNIPAKLEIPKLKISAPLYFSKSIDSIYTDLKSGVAHFTGTPLPGDHGTSYVVGHSSNYPWIVSKYNKIFASLDKLADGETFTVTVTLLNGQQKVITYKVAGRGLFLPDDQKQFVNYAASRIALSTCWPPSSTTKRLVVFGEVISIK